MRVFDIDRLAVLMLPIALRRPKMIAFVGVLLQPIAVLLSRFSRRVDEVDYALAHNSQVTKLRSMLNDLLDDELRRIEIVDAARTGGYWLVYRRDLNKPTVIADDYPQLVYARGYRPEWDLDFVVRVPAEWRGDASLMARLRSLVNTYKLASKRYDVEYI